MSEKKPEIIYISGIAAKILVEKGVMWDNNTYTNDTTMHGVYYDIPYILKQTHDKEVEDLKAEIERLKNCMKLGNECIKIWIKHNNEEIDVMDREFLKQSEQLLK